MEKKLQNEKKFQTYKDENSDEGESQVTKWKWSGHKVCRNITDGGRG